MADAQGSITFEGVRLLFRNFAGNAGMYNKEGERSFAIELDDDLAQRLLKDGWNVKYPKPNDHVDPEEDVRQPYLPVKVGYKVRPPKVTVITSVGRTSLTQESIGTLDWAEIQNCDVIVAPYHWSVNDKTGIAAYLKTMYVTIEEDELERKYALMGLED